MNNEATTQKRRNTTCRPCDRFLLPLVPAFIYAGWAWILKGLHSVPKVFIVTSVKGIIFVIALFVARWAQDRWDKSTN